MPNYCCFKVEVDASNEQWDSVVAFLTPCIVVRPIPDSMYGPAKLMLDKLWPDLDPEKTLTWVGFYGFENFMFYGACGYSAPFTFLIRLSLRFPDLAFRLGATVEYDENANYVVQNGVVTVVDEFFQRGNESIWYMRDGVELNPPEHQDESDDPIVPDAPDTYEV